MSERMAGRHRSAVLDTSVVIDLGLLEPSRLPLVPEVTAITLAELHQGVAMATGPAERARRTELVGAVTAEFDPLPFDDVAAARYGTLCALVVDAGRSPRPRRLDLMIAAIASSMELPLYTRNGDDFLGLDEVLEIETV